MPTKTERILSYLPGTFRRSPQQSALYALADAFGTELLKGENSLAALMQAHWVDHADRGAEIIDDLARIAALYGLKPRCPSQNENEDNAPKLCALPVRCDESVEEFRRHLKRYVRTFLDGTVTVQGILRVVAEALGLEIADDYAAMQTWWQAPSDELVTTVADGKDSALFLLGSDTITATGSAAQSAQVTGSVDLSQGIDLGETTRLRLQIDAQSPVEIDLAEGAANPVDLSLDWIQVAINVGLGAQVARHDGCYLTLASPTLGPSSRLAVLEVANDAAPKLLGLAAFTAQGQAARAAAVRGQADLSSGVDLSDERYLRLRLDGALSAEIDCAGPAPSHTSLDEIVVAISSALAASGVTTPVASHDGRFLHLTSPTTGATSTIVLLPPAAQDATTRLFGSVATFHSGQVAQPARVTSRRDLRAGIDLRQCSNLQISIDGGDPITVNCAGSDPAKSTLSEIAAAINTACRATVASHDGRFLTLASPTVGPASALSLAAAVSGDALTEIMGITPRLFHGLAASAARITGQRDLGAGVNLTAHYKLGLVIDGASPLTADLHNGISDPTLVALDDLVAALNRSAGQEIATCENGYLVLTSPTVGAQSSLAIMPLRKTVRRRFVTRATILDEAATALLGFVSKRAQGKAAQPAALVGKIDLSRGVNLRDSPYLRLAVDDRPAVDIDCRGKRPHITVLDEVVAKINATLDLDVATHNGKNLLLTSPTVGVESRLVLEPPRSQDALATLLGVAPGAVRGQEGTQVRFVSTVDLSNGVDLPAGAAIRLGVDGVDPIEVTLTGTEMAHKTLDALVIAINLALGRNVASHDTTFLTLSSLRTGAESQLVFMPVTGADATAALFGITPLRTYQGRAARAAEVLGQVDLSTGTNLSRTRFLRLAVNEGEIKTIDCASEVTDPAQASLDKIVEAINRATQPGIASAEDGRLVLRSPTSGGASRLTLAAYTGGDAQSLLLGDVAAETPGEAPTPAKIVGEVDLLPGVNLAGRTLLRLAVDGGRPIDIAVADLDSAKTFGEEMIAAINRVLPGVAALTSEDRLQLTSPTVGETSQLEVLPLRYLELVEYPPTADGALIENVRHGGTWSVVNNGAADVLAEIKIIAPHGVVGPALVNAYSGVELRLLTTLTAGAMARLWHDPDQGLQVEIATPGDDPQPLPADKIVLTSVEKGLALTTPHEQAALLQLPQGRSIWRYRDCYNSRFNQANFNQARFVGGACTDRGVFNVSRFVQDVQTSIQAVFTGPPPLADPPVQISFSWACHQAGAFQVNLPVDLPLRFGGRFNSARFGQAPNAPEVYRSVVTGPEGDDHFLIDLIKQNPNSLVQAKITKDPVPLGWSAVPMPLRQPQFLTGGRADRAAAVYLQEGGVDGFIELQAREVGAWGNTIALSTRQVGPGLYDVCVLFQGDRFENARQVALGDPLPVLTQELLQPGAIGILQAKAAGVRAEVTREQT